MSKVTTYLGARIVIDVPEARMHFPSRNKEDIRRLVESGNEILGMIRRRVDELGARAGAVEIAQESVCGYCGYAWTEDSSTYNGGCCDADCRNDPGLMTER